MWGGQGPLPDPEDERRNQRVGFWLAVIIVVCTFTLAAIIAYGISRLGH